MDFKKALGFTPEDSTNILNDEKVIQYINLKLTASGQPIYGTLSDSFLDIAQPLLNNVQEKNRLLSNYLCPADRRIQDFLDDYFEDCTTKKILKLPVNPFILDCHGLARILSLPPNGNAFASNIVSSYRVAQGILHNPKSDRRTTQGVFHIAEGGLPIPADKAAVPKPVFYKLLMHALRPPKELLTLPFTSAQKDQAAMFVSLLLRPVVCPEVPGFIQEKTMEIRFFAPGSLVSNLDFVESIFGNAGDPYLPENDAGLDVEHWTGHSGCVILAPHLIALKKKDLGLPPISEATERQKQDGMCWSQENELYNDGKPFKVTCRSAQGVMVTLIADNYFGYCKKEVKTQISFSANLFGLCEEEHSGGAIAFPSYDLGEDFMLLELQPAATNTFEDISKRYSSLMHLHPEGYGVDKKYPDIIYVSENSNFNLSQQSVSWTQKGKPQKIKILANNTYILPSGYRIHIKKQTGGHAWILIGTVAEGTFCHKPCTVSGGGKSEISKSIVDAMIQGQVFTSDFYKDLELVAGMMSHNFADRFKKPLVLGRPSRPILSPKRSLGSVIKLLTPSPEYTDAYNAWLETIPPHIKDIIYVVKRYYRAEWGENWKEHFSVDVINGHLSHELKYNNRELVANYLRVGREKDGSWRIYKVRQDFSPAQKIQTEDDITASVVVAKEAIEYLNTSLPYPSVKLVKNCEYRLFQRPDDAIIRGYDKQAEIDISSVNSFLSNYEPLTLAQAKEIVEDVINYDRYTEPVKQLLTEFVKADKEGYIVIPSHPRLVDGQQSKNPRYLQNRPDLMNPRAKYLAEVSTRLSRLIAPDKPVLFAVNSVLPGRRNNPPDVKAKIRPLAIYNPIHYQELPELFMDFVCSVTGRSPSTTGFGSEGALTKGPFNALWPTADLNNALVSYILTGYHGFTTAAGHIGPNIRIDHDISLLVPEIWSRMSEQERDPKFLIQNGYLEKLEDFDYKGRKIPVSRIGYRITLRFVHAFLGRIFNNPHVVFSPEMLKPELQSLEVFVDGIENIITTQKNVAEHYFSDGSIESACPPLKALLHIMAFGNYEGKNLNHPEVRNMFTRDYLLKSDWYQERLKTKQDREIVLWQSHIKYLENFLKKISHAEKIVQLGIHDRLAKAKDYLKRVKSPDYIKSLIGTIGADPFHHQLIPTEPREAVAAGKPNSR